MAAESLVMSAGAVAVNDNLTRYTPVCGGGVGDSVEAQVQIPVRIAGSFSKLFTYVPTNTASVTTTVTLRNNTADTALTVSYTADQTGVKEDTSNSVSVGATDEVNYEITVPSEAGTNTFTLNLAGMMFTPTDTSAVVSWLASGAAAGTVNFASTTRFIAVAGVLDATTTESLASWRCRGAFTARDFYVYVSANARTTDTTFTIRKNAGSAGISVTYTSGQTGVKEDTTTASLAAGDDVNFGVTTSTGTESMTVRMIACHLTSTAGLFPLISADVNGEAVAASLTRFLACAGNMNGGFDATEVNAQILPRFTFTAKELTANISANSITVLASTVTLRDNGADSALTLSYDAGETGVKSDSSNTATITGGTDEIALAVVTPATTGSLTFRHISLLGEVSVTAAGGRPGLVGPAFHLAGARGLAA